MPPEKDLASPCPRKYLFLYLEIVSECDSCNLVTLASCPRCSCDNESLLCVLQDCPYSYELWLQMNVFNQALIT